MSARAIPAPVLTRQAQASDPQVSAFVSANAGAGKTHVLAQRVIRLLLAGTDPMKILCITFTKAAAANMAARVFDTLAHWIALDDDALDREMRAIGETRVGPAQRARARRLFASALDTPGGLKVQTIHAFCTRLLHQFPFEANVAARFTVLDEASETQLLDQLSLSVLLDAASAPKGPLGEALAKAIVAAADQTFKELVGEAIAARDTLQAWLEHAGSLDAAETREQIEGALLGEALIGETQWREIAAALAQGSSRDGRQAELIAGMLAARGAARLEAYLDIFSTERGDKR